MIGGGAFMHFFIEDYWNQRPKGERHEKEHRFASHFAPGVAHLVLYFFVGPLIARL